jgi:hypothetical protein
MTQENAVLLDFDEPLVERDPLRRRKLVQPRGFERLLGVRVERLEVIHGRNDRFLNLNAGMKKVRVGLAVHASAPIFVPILAYSSICFAE